MKLDDFSFWQNWPVGQRRRYFMIIVLLWALLWMLGYALLSWSADAAEREASRLRSEYERVAPLVQEIQTMQAKVGNLASLSPLAAAQQVSRDLNLEEQLASIRPSQLAGGQEGVQLFFQGLDLQQFMALLQTLSERGRMKIVSFVVNKRMNAPQKADLQLVLVR